MQFCFVQALHNCLTHKEVPGGSSLYDDKKYAGYYREITLLDQQVGRLRNELKSMGIANNTILWYCSDNGGLVKVTSGGREKKGSVYEGGLRVPAVLEWPARKLKGRTAVPVSTCDMYPTLMAMAGVKWDAPHPLDGIDVSDIISGKVEKRSKPMGFWHKFQGGQGTWSDRIQKAIMKKQQAGAPLPHDPSRVRKDVDEFPHFPEDLATGHAAWTAALMAFAFTSIYGGVDELHQFIVPDREMDVWDWVADTCGEVASLPTLTMTVFWIYTCRAAISRFPRNLKRMWICEAIFGARSCARTNSLPRTNSGPATDGSSIP